VKYLILDTDFLIKILRNDKTAKDYLEKILSETNDFFITHVTLWELYQGVYNSSKVESNLKATEELIEYLDVLPFTQAVAKKFGFLITDLNKKGTPIGVMDTLIVSTALVYNLPLVTKNRSHFDKTGIMIMEW